MFMLGSGSLKRLEAVSPTLVMLVKDAITITKQDFSVLEGLRSIEDEQKHIDNHTSKLHDPRNCKHCAQLDGFSHAVDLVPYVNNEPSWDWQYIWAIAFAMRDAAIRHKVLIKWGAVWDKPLNSLSGDLKKEAHDYCERHPGKDFEDGPHYELI